MDPYPPDDLLQALADAGRAFGAVPAEGVGRPVAACPGWDVEALAGHVGRIVRWGAANAAGGGEQVRRRDVPEPPEGAAVLGWVVDGTAEAVAGLAGLADDRPAWTWAGPGTAGWWRRRLAHELVVHAWDAQAAIGDPAPIAAPLAVDGLDELLGVFLPRVDDQPGDDATVHLHATDADGEWLVTFAAGGPTIAHEHAKGDAAVRGRAEDLLLATWGRVPVDRLERFGQADLYDRIRAAAT
ncbi:MAG: maleylpyruvate isomerase family mycothiol-dependent enzyme [Acidimicrobiales bacterium]